ncbi:hypothetical protein [Synechococcus sp. 1G10]|uniref:hypothetical protein n=1 Tax=Synechococcus sp. 1G10 TaxID=2025605 RepID=UPI000B97D0C9|nr:hypothetical protein [Synechococcus sp. 1G10]
MRVQAQVPHREAEGLLQKIMEARLMNDGKGELALLQERLLRLEENDPWIALERGKAYQARNDRAPALAQWQQAFSLSGQDLVLLRKLNDCSPHLVQRHVQNLKPPAPGSRVAIVLPGELRCWQRNASLFIALSEHCDLFICTSESYAEVAKGLAAAPHLRVRLVEDDPTLPVPSMQQWMRLAHCLDMIRIREKESGHEYTHIIKLRSDYFYVQPEDLLASVTGTRSGFWACSDKVFGGDRATMMLWDAFHQAIPGFFDNNEDRYFPVNMMQILRSEDSFKWFGMLFPVEVVGKPDAPVELRKILLGGGEPLARTLATYGAKASPLGYTRLFQGHERFASEVSFARFLNFTGVSVGWKPALSGFLWSDRHQYI